MAELGARDHRATTPPLAKHADIVVIGVLKGSVIFLADLVRHIAAPIYRRLHRHLVSYGDATVSSGVVQITQDVSRPIEGKHVIVVEDIVDTGHTVHYLLANMATRQPASIIKLCLAAPQARARGARGQDRLSSASPSRTSLSSATASTSPSSTGTCRSSAYVQGAPNED